MKIGKTMFNKTKIKRKKVIFNKNLFINSFYFYRFK